MTYQELTALVECKNEEEMRIKSVLLGIRPTPYVEKLIKYYRGLEPWKRTIELYRFDCKERGVQCIL